MAITFVVANQKGGIGKIAVRVMAWDIDNIIGIMIKYKEVIDSCIIKLLYKLYMWLIYKYTDMFFTRRGLKWLENAAPCVQKKN